MKIIFALVLCIAGCATENTETKTALTMPSAPVKSLYDRLGGKPAITAVVDDFVANIAADKRVNSFFAKTNIPHLKAMLVEQICQASGGPCEYTGKDMKTVHTGMNIQDAHFSAVVDDLVKALNKFKVGEKEKSDLIGALGGMKGDIVGL